MFPQKSPVIAEVEPKTYPLGEKFEHSLDGPTMALVALSHTPVERRLYTAMISSVNGSTEKSADVFTVKALMDLTGIISLSTIRRGLEGLVAKFSIEREIRPNGNGAREHSFAYRAFGPEEVLARREARGIKSYATGIERSAGTRSFQRVIQRVAENRNLSRREVQVALCCVEGLPNAEIGARLQVSEQTVKFHLRHIFLKFGVKRRAELISRLLL
jgi:DNA-binding CsgD family transcriptional regulator